MSIEAATAGIAQGDVTVYHFPGILGALGWGWLHPRFLVLEHSVLLVYASEDDWAEHREPLDDLTLSHDSAVELVQEGGEVVVKVRFPDSSSLSFKGSPDEMEPSGLTSEAWVRALDRVISSLRRETAPARPRTPSSSPSRAASRTASRTGSRTASRTMAPEFSGGGGGVASWRLWGLLGMGSSSAEDAPSLLELPQEEGDGSEDEWAGSNGGGDEGKDDNAGDTEVVREAGEGGRGGGGGGGVVGGSITGRGRDSSVSSRQSRGSAVLRRWPLRRAGPNRGVPDDGATAAAAADAATTTAAIGAPRAAKRGSVNSGDGGGGGVGGVGGGGGGEMAVALWRKAAAAFRRKDCANCDCKWCQDGGGSGSHRQHPKQPVLAAGSFRHRCSWSKRPSRDTTPAVDRWEYLVGRWIPLQLARSGDVLGIRRFLEKFPAYPDKPNLLRAAVRYKQYSLVEYFLDEQHMDVNLENVAGMPLVWFSVVFMQKGDSGVMLRYLLQKGADIKTKNLVGQTVLFLVVSSRGKEAIPMLKYLVEECGLSLTDRDDFGALPLHFAVLYGHMDTVQWISLNSRHIAARADWAKAFERMQKIRLVRPEHMGAVRSWRMRGLQKSARSLTPLGVAVLHNHEGIAKWLMGYDDVNPRCVACKRNNLFSEHNKDLSLVAKTWPELLPGVLQGFEQKESLARTSWDTDDKLTVAPTGWSERTYDIKLLYGSPEVPPSRSPLTILLSTDHPQLFEVKAVQMVVALKWSIFGHRYYVWELGRYLALSISFVVGFIICGGSGNWIGPLGADVDKTEVVSGTVTRMVCWVLTLYNLLVEEGRELRAAKSVKKYLLGGWNLQSVVAYVLVLALIPVFKPWQREVVWDFEGDFSDDETHSQAGIVRRVMTAPAALFLFTRLMEHLAVWRSTGIFIAVIRMMIVNTASWSVLFILFEVAFALAFYALLQGNPGFETVWESMVSLFVMSMGEITIPFSDDKYLHIVGVLMFVTFMLLVAIVYLNLLVAIMTSGYTEVASGANAQAMMNRAAALVKWEGIMSEKTRIKSFRSISPGKGKRSHITLKGWFGGAATEVFCADEGATAVEPEQRSSDKRVDALGTVLKELAEMREVLERATRGGFRRAPPADAEDVSSSDNQESSFRRRQAGMLDASGKGLSQLRLGPQGRKASTGSVSAMSIQEWREKARAVQEQAHSRRGVVRAQAAIRGYLSRSRSRARFLPDNQDETEAG